MNVEMLQSSLRILLLGIGGILVGKGYMTQGDLEMYVGAALYVGISIWALKKRREAEIIASAASMDSVQQIVAPKIADKIDSDKVVKY